MGCNRGIVLLLFWGIVVQAQIERLEPPNWWIGMQQDTLQLLVYGEDIAALTPSLLPCQECTYISDVHKADSPNYLFIDLVIPPTTLITQFPILFSNKEGKQFQYQYELKQRSKKPKAYRGFNSTDVLYLITPDRFANGDPKNDSVRGLLETEVNRADNYKRHGGDIQGITDHLDYIFDMGFTAIWPNPLLLNDMQEQSYHGYAITDFYKVDPRFGTLEAYQQLSQKAAQKGIKLIMDQVVNHCGKQHWWMEDLPFFNWINYQEDFTSDRTLPISNHRRTTNQDNYASEYDKTLMEKGWFVSAMPDLNQRNAFMAKYLIQNSIWWIETLALGGIRQDTYPYPNKHFMAQWAKAIMQEYPNFSIVGEEWSYNPLLVGYWQDGAANKDGYRSYLSSTMDFPLQKAIIEALTEKENWDSGLIKLYEGLANDFYYSDPGKVLLFGDNHDMDRLFTQLNEDVSLVKMAMAFILVAPRIPQIYYGTEILLQNTNKRRDHGSIRTDFPGGWPKDNIDAFAGDGLSAQQLDMQSYLKKLLNFRKNSPVIHQGSTKHFTPEQGIYVLFRYSQKNIIMLVLNKNEEEKIIGLERFAEMGIVGKTGLNIITSERKTLTDALPLQPREALILAIENRP
ncbi:MAG: glycoside hydrolase family 13 protein [Bacteroidota bacterium]